MKFILLFCFFTTLSSNEKYLKSILSSEEIVKSYEISIPGFENATNPSIIAYKDGYLLSFRYNGRFPEWSKDIRLHPVACLIGLVYLDKQFRVKKNSIQLLEIQSFSEDLTLYAEDARLFVFQGRIFITFNDTPAAIREYRRRHYLAEIVNEKGRWILKERARSLFSDDMGGVEKNWVPFCCANSLYFIYADDPHRILECDLSTGYCRKIDESKVDLHWPYGEIRGGTPAFQIDDQFLTFYHSRLEPSDTLEQRTYFMGAYMFDAFFPFTVRAYTPQPLGVVEHYKKSSTKKHDSKKVVFPGGYVREGNQIHIAWGKDDKMIMITTLDLERLLKSMKKI